MIHQGWIFSQLEDEFYISMTEELQAVKETLWRCKK